MEISHEEVEKMELTTATTPHYAPCEKMICLQQAGLSEGNVFILWKVEYEPSQTESDHLHSEVNFLWQNPGGVGLD